MGAAIQGKSSRIGQAGGRSRAHRPMSEINVTPMVDVMLVLLIVFMVTAPLLTTGVPVDMPKADARAIKDEDNKALEITLTKEKQLFVGETKVERERLIELLTAMTNNDPERRIYIRADQALSYGEVMEVLGGLNKAGFRKVALLSNSSSKKQP
ncbi:MAG: protein TolR [Alphaproteobacteria bacterium]|nr:protein TolR [Alphaproteobacteria bacterium]